MIRIALSAAKSFLSPFFLAGFPVALLLALYLPVMAQAQNPPGRILSIPGSNIIECNVDGSNCFTVVNNGGGLQSSPAGASGVSVAADGTIAFSALSGPNGTCAGPCNPHVFLMNADGTNVRQITFNPASTAGYEGEGNVTISPDGTMVAFISSQNEAPDTTHPNQIYLVNADGSNLRQLTPFMVANGQSQGSMFSMAWSPDSTKLAFRGTVYTSACGTYEGSPIWVEVIGTINADGTNMQYPLACDNGDGDGPLPIDWSPDGTLLAWGRSVSHGAQGCSGCVGEPAVAFYGFNGTTPADITSAELGTDSCSGPHCMHFSPDGTQLAFLNQYPNNGNPCSPCYINTIGLSSLSVTATNIPYGDNLWWAQGAALPAPAQMTLAPSTVEFWPGFNQQLVPSLVDASNNLIMHTAASFGSYVNGTSSCYYLSIGPYGLFLSATAQAAQQDYLTASNEGITSGGVPLVCWNSPPCTYTLSSNNENFGSSGGSGSVNITTNPGGTTSTCPWGATSSVPWITINAASLTGAGNGTLNFQFTPNGGTAREGTITIGGSTTLTINQSQSGVLQSIAVTPANPSVPAGSNEQFDAMGTYSDGSMQDLTTSVTWSSSNTAVATISNISGSQGLASAVAAGGPITITATLNSINGTTQLTVMQPTSTTLGSSQNPSAPGQPVTFTATVAPTSGSGAPTGTVTFYDGSTALGPGTLSAGTTTLTTSALAIGSHSITAVYSGDSNFAGSTSAGLTQTVSKISTTTSLQSSVNPSVPGQSVTFTATINWTGSGTPTGTVTFYDGAANIGTGTPSAGKATLTTLALAVGSHSITAAYGGDSNFTGSTSAPLSQVVSKSGTSTTLQSSLNPSVYGQSVTFTATVTGSGSGSPTGTVTFMDGSTLLGTGPLSGSKAIYSTSALAAGSHAIMAAYSGDANFTASTSTSLGQTVNRAATTTAVASSTNPSVAGQTVTFTATVSPTGSGTAGGTVTFMDGSSVLGTSTLNASSQATLASSTLTAGTHSITAVFAGTANFAGSTSPVLSQRVTDFSISATPATQSIKAGKSATFTVTLAPVSGFTGLVSLACSGAPSKGSCAVAPNSLTLNGTANGTSKLTVKTASSKNGTPAGSYSVTVTGTFGTLNHSTTVTVIVQ